MPEKQSAYIVYVNYTSKLGYKHHTLTIFTKKQYVYILFIACENGIGKKYAYYTTLVKTVLDQHFTTKVTRSKVTNNFVIVLNCIN